MKKKQIITDEERMGFEAFNELVSKYFEEEANKPWPTVTYLPSARLNMEDIFAPSDDTNHPNFKCHA